MKVAFGVRISSIDTAQELTSRINLVERPAVVVVGPQRMDGFDCGMPEFPVFGVVGLRADATEREVSFIKARSGLIGRQLTRCELLFHKLNVANKVSA